MERKKDGEKELIRSLYKALKGFSSTLPMLIGVLLLLGLFQTYVTEEMMRSVFTGEPFCDTLLGALLGSVSAGNPLTSYLIGGELVDQGVTLFAVTAFIVTWVTVGVAQFPAEAGILGRKFAVRRNVLSFLLALGVSLATVLTLRVIG
jgi:uncharacterized membrane protein YraQ (UPF0718 family)